MSTSLALSIPAFAASAILLAGVIDDLRSRKVHNWLFLSCAAFALVVALATGGWAGLSNGVLGFMAGVAVFPPLVLAKMVGAGDMKLLAAFGILAGWSAVLSVAVYALLWGVLFGVIQVIVKGQGKVLINNMLSIVVLKDRQNLVLHKIPFTIALLVGWMTHLVLR